MTNKEIVLRRHPNAKCFTDKSRFTDESNSVVVSKIGLISLAVLGQGKTPRQAWASAAETVRRGK